MQENRRMKYTLEEVLGHMPVSDAELEIPRTNDMADSLDPNWDTTFKRWSMGLQNSHDTKLANIIASRNKDAFSLSDFLDFVRWNQSQVLNWMSSIIDKILTNKG